MNILNPQTQNNIISKVITSTEFNILIRKYYTVPICNLRLDLENSNNLWLDVSNILINIVRAKNLRLDCLDVLDDYSYIINNLIQYENILNIIIDNLKSRILYLRKYDLKVIQESEK